MYYFVLTKGQTLWWDEAEYMAGAKHWALGVPYKINEQRPPLFQFLGAILIKLGFGENMLKFSLVLIPSLLVVIATYWLGKELFNKKVALISSFASAFLWTFLFWTVRFQPDFFSLSFQLFALTFFWKLFKEEKPKLKTKYALCAGIFCALGFYFKISSLLVPLSAIVFAFTKDGLKLFKRQEYWIAVGTFIIALIPFMAWQYYSFGNPIAFAPSYTPGIGIEEGRPLGLMTFGFYSLFPGAINWFSFRAIFFFLFVIGLIIALGKIVLTIDVLWHKPDQRINPDIFSIIILAVVSLFYVFYIKGTIEDRWIFLLFPFIFYLLSKGLLEVSKKISKSHIKLGAIIIIVVMISFTYYQLKDTDLLINVKKETYRPIKDASIFMRDNSVPTDKILSISYTQSTVYSEREVIPFVRMNEENFTNLIDREKPKYILLSIWEPNHPEWLIKRMDSGNGNWGIVMEYFNSTIFLEQNQVKQVDLKTIVEKDKNTFTLVYPLNTLDGTFVYKIEYK